ncbi:hypothetical protein EVAR_101308_1 [Eumeta japonica]|uniref:Uncharacterized protein n=1 Tax=Eumeta variegata TaxID=151549 RepID=A0A4C2AGC8_EUMVA|nr:hypothetical protein EVAR_101308_1 [Eumeta japonica]
MDVEFTLPKSLKRPATVPPSEAQPPTPIRASDGLRIIEIPSSKSQKRLYCGQQLPTNSVDLRLSVSWSSQPTTASGEAGKTKAAPAAAKTA